MRIDGNKRNEREKGRQGDGMEIQISRDGRKRVRERKRGGEKRVRERKREAKRRREDRMRF